MPIKGKVSKALEWGQEGDINGTVDEAITRFLAAFGKKNTFTSQCRFRVIIYKLK